MSIISENESWIVDIGDVILKKKSHGGIESLSARERLIYCLWVVDYCMRNAGDLVQVNLLHPNCLQEAARLSQSLSLTFSGESFSLPQSELEAQYEARFEHICNEIKGAQR